MRNRKPQVKVQRFTIMTPKQNYYFSGKRELQRLRQKVTLCKVNGNSRSFNEERDFIEILF